MKSLRGIKSISEKAVGVSGFIIVVLMTIAMIHDAGSQERFVIFRYWNMIITGFMAFIIPHLLYPEKSLSTIQTLNLKPAQIIKYQLLAQKNLLITIGVSYLIIAFFNPTGWTKDFAEKLTIFIDGLLFLTGIFGYAYFLYSKVGIESQEWQEGIKGNYIRGIREETGGIPIGIGSIPTIKTTINITIMGMLSVVLGAYLSTKFHFPMDWLPGVILFAFGGIPLISSSQKFDRFFYQTNAFYSDYLSERGYDSNESGRTATYDNIYWVPHRWRPTVWAEMIQLDRAFPMGRIVFLGHFILWMLFYFDVSHTIRSSYLLIFIISQNLSLYLLTIPRLGPISWNYRLQNSFNWVMTRFFIQIRWVLPLGLSLSAVAIFSGAFTWSEMAYWTVLFIIFDLFFSLLLTLFHEHRFTTRYA